MIYDRAKSESATNVVKALQELERAAQVIGAFFVDHDLLLTPTMARPAAPLGLLDTANPVSIWEHSAGYSGLTSPFNSSGQPAISLPMGHDSAGVPIGVQLVGAFGREDLLIQVASQLETARPWSIAPGVAAGPGVARGRPEPGRTSGDDANRPLAVHICHVPPLAEKVLGEIALPLCVPIGLIDHEIEPQDVGEPHGQLAGQRCRSFGIGLGFVRRLQ